MRSAILFKLDPQTNRIVSFFPVRIGMMAVGGGSVWITDLNAHAVFRYNTATGREVARIPVGARNEPCWLAAGGTAAWVTVCLSTAGTNVSRMDPATNRVVDRIQFERGSPTITYADGYLWAVTTSTSDPPITVRRLDPATNEFVGQAIAIPDDPTAEPHSRCEHLGFAEESSAGVGAGAVWVTDCPDAEVVRVQF